MRRFGVHQIQATGARTATTYLRGDGTWGTPSGGGAGGAGSDRRWLPGPGEDPIDEFDNAALDPAWVRVDRDAGAVGRQNWTEGADTLAGTNQGGDSAQELHALLRPVAPVAVGDAILGCYSLFGSSGTNYAMAGLVLTNGTTYGSGIQVAGFSFASTVAGRQANSVRHYTGFNTQAAAAADMFTTYGVPNFARLVHVSSGVWRYDLSPDGNGWLIGSTLAVAGFTPTHVGLFATSYGTGTKHVASHEFLRRTSGVT